MTVEDDAATSPRADLVPPLTAAAAPLPLTSLLVRPLGAGLVGLFHGVRSDSMKMSILIISGNDYTVHWHTETELHGLDWTATSCCLLSTVYVIAARN